MVGQFEVSVIIPIYKISEKYLEKCIQSLVIQESTKIEIILVDDGSTESNAEFCDNFAEHHNNCRVIHQQNQGVSSARNRGMEDASAEWIMFVDPDDYTKPSLVSSLLKNCDEETDIVCCCCDVLFDNNKIETDYFFSNNRDFKSSREKKDLYLQLMNPRYKQPGSTYTAIGVPWGKLYRRSFLEKNGLLFDPSLRRMQDNIFNMYAFYWAKRVRYVNQPLYVYRYEHINKAIKFFDPKYIETIINILRKRQKCLNDTGLIEKQDLYFASLEEGFDKIKEIYFSGPFHQKNFAMKKERFRQATKILSVPEVQAVLSNIKAEKIKFSIKDCLYYNLIKGKHWRLLELLCSIRNCYK